MTPYGYARVSVREPEDKNLDLQVERLVRAGCSLGNIRAEEASGARNDRGGLLELLDLVVEGDGIVSYKVVAAATGTGPHGATRGTIQRDRPEPCTPGGKSKSPSESFLAGSV